MKDYQEFMEEVTEKLKEVYDDTYTIQKTQISKNNGIMRDGVVISAKGEAVVPTIYLDNFYEVYKAGMTIEHCL